MDGNFPENEVFLVISIGIAVMLLFAMAFVLFFYFSQKKFQSERLSSQERELEYQQQLLYANLEGQENERERISRELHDAVGSKLNVINLGLHHISKTSNDETIADLFEVLKTTIENTRQMSHDLLPPTLESFGLALALEELCENYNKAEDINVIFKVALNDNSSIDSSVSLNFFRIAQELLSNGLKHSEASKIEIVLWIHRYHVRMTYRDDGKGFDSNDPQNQRGLGMRNIASRVRMIKANKKLESTIDGGVFFELLKQRI